MNNLCLFVHYDQNNVYSEDDINYITNLCKIYEKITILTSNSGKIENFSFDSQIEYILDIPNYGADFGKIQFYLNKINFEDYENIFIFNNSCIVVRDLSKSLNYMNKKNLDFWGYTTSLEKKLHIQSYFYFFNKKTIKIFVDHLNKIDPYGKNLKYTEIIDNIEIEMLNVINKMGFKCGSYLHTHKIPGSLNPTLFHIDKMLILNHDYPFIKKKIFTHFKNFDRKYLESLV